MQRRRHGDPAALARLGKEACCCALRADQPRTLNFDQRSTFAACRKSHYHYRKSSRIPRSCFSADHRQYPFIRRRAATHGNTVRDGVSMIVRFSLAVPRQPGVPVFPPSSFLFAALPYCRRPYVKGYVPSRFLAATHARSRAFAGRQGRKNRAIAQAIQLFLCEAI